MWFRQVAFLVVAVLSAIVAGCRAMDPDKTDKDTPEDPDAPSEVTSGIPSCEDGWDIYIAGTYRYGPSIIINDDGSIDAWFAASGDYHGKGRMLLNTIVDPIMPIL